MTHDPEPASAIGREKENVSDARGASWWQWALLHPALPVALVSAIGGAVAAGTPQFLQWWAARALNVAPSELARALEQRRAWEDNRECLSEIQHVNLRSPSSYTISLQSCPTGDILLAVTALHAPEARKYEWIITKNMFNLQTASSVMAPTLAQGAGSAGPMPTQVIDVRMQGGNIVRRLQLSNKTCIDEVVEAATGRRLSSQSAPCSRF